MPNPLSDTLIGNPDDASGLKYGVIATINPITVRVGASTLATECRCLGSYVPVVGDYVAVWVSGADRLILGSTSTTGYSPPVIPDFPVADGVWTHNPNTLDFATISGGSYSYYAIPRNRYMRMANGTVVWQVIAFLGGPTKTGILTLAGASAPFTIWNSETTAEGGDGGIFGDSFRWWLPIGSGYVQNSLSGGLWYPVVVAHNGVGADDTLYFIYGPGATTDGLFDDGVYGPIGHDDTVAFTVTYEDAAGRLAF